MSYKPYYTGGWQNGESGQTPITAEALNHLEQGIQSAEAAAEKSAFDLKAAEAFHLIVTRQLADAVTAERHTITLTNTDKYPFNNSAQTIALDERRNNTEYTVEPEVLSRSGTVGDIVIYDKQTNGFKVKFEGSGTRATVLLKVTGGL